MYPGDQVCVSHVELAECAQGAAVQGEGVYAPLVVPRPHLLPTVGHGQQERAQLQGGTESVCVSVCVCVRTVSLLTSLAARRSYRATVLSVCVSECVSVVSVWLWFTPGV